jgi:hypothetical protein
VHAAERFQDTVKVLPVRAGGAIQSCAFAYISPVFG